MKKCFKCLETKTRSEFYSHPKTADGLLGKCKSCTKKDSNDRFNAKMLEPEWGIAERKRQRIKEEKRRAGGKTKTYIHSKARPPKQQRDANVAFNNAVRDGRIVKCPCVV